MSDKEYLTEGTDRLLADMLKGLAGINAIPVSFCTKLLYDAFGDKAKFNILKGHYIANGANCVVQYVDVGDGKPDENYDYVVVAVPIRKREGSAT